MKSSEILRCVRKEIEAERETFICVALQHPTYGVKAWKIRKRIQSALGKYGNQGVSMWLVNNSAEYRRFTRKAGSFKCGKQLKIYRLRWIDWMIEGYKAIGD